MTTEKKNECEIEWDKYANECFRMEPYTSHSPEERDFKAGWGACAEKAIDKHKLIEFLKSRTYGDILLAWIEAGDFNL